MDWTWLPEQRRMVHLGQQLGDVDPQERQRPTGDAAAIQALGSPVFQPQILPAATVNMPPWPGQAVFATPYGVDASYGSMVWGGASLQATPWRSQPAAPRFGAGMSLSRGRGRIRTSSRSLISSARGQRAGSLERSSSDFCSNYDSLLMSEDAPGLTAPRVRITEVVQSVLAAPAQQPQQLQLQQQLVVSDELLKGLLSLGSRGVAAVLKEVAKEPERHGQVTGMVRASALFTTLRSTPEGSPTRSLCDAYTYTAMITLCTMQQDPRQALDVAFGLMEDMQMVGVAANVHTYTALMNVCIKNREYERALQVFEAMRAARVLPNVVTWNTLVDVYGKLGKASLACGVLDMMRAEGTPPAQRTYNTIIIACNTCGQPQQALQMYCRMLADNVPPNSTTCNALISAYGKTRNLASALAVYQDMITRGMDRSVITYSSLISACEKAGDWRMALNVFDDMRGQGCAPNTITFNSLITACAQAAQWQHAREVYEQMVGAGCTPDVVTYTSLIAAYARGGQWRAALRAFADMCSAGCAPDAIIYNAIIDALWETGIVWAQGAAMKLFRAAQQQGLFAQQPLLATRSTASISNISSLRLPEGEDGESLDSQQGLRASSLPLLTSEGDVAGGSGRRKPARVLLSMSASAGDPPSSNCHELDLHAMTGGVAMVSLCAWMAEVRNMVVQGRVADLLPRMAVVVDAGRASWEAGNAVVRDAITAMCTFYESPFRTAPHPVYTCVLEAATRDVAAWVTNHGMDALLASVFTFTPPHTRDGEGDSTRLGAGVGPHRSTAQPPPQLQQGQIVGGLQLPGMGPALPMGCRPQMFPTHGLRQAHGIRGRGGRGPVASAIVANASAVAMAAVAQTEAREVAVSPQCDAAFAQVEAFERNYALSATRMRQPYLMVRAQLISHMLDLTSRLGVTDEVVHDAVQIMDRAACEPNLLCEDYRGMAEAVLRIAISQAMPSLGPEPRTPLANLDAVLTLPAPRVSAAEWEVRRALRGDCSASSAMRVIKLYLERMGYRGLGAAGVYGLGGYAIMLAVEGLYDTGLLSVRPSLVAAALLWSERRLRGVVPCWPSVLARMTRTPDVTANTQLAAATRLAQNLARKPIYALIYRTQLAAMCAPASHQGMQVGSPGLQAAAVAASDRGHTHSSLSVHGLSLPGSGPSSSGSQVQAQARVAATAPTPAQVQAQASPPAAQPAQASASGPHQRVVGEGAAGGGAPPGLLGCVAEPEADNSESPVSCKEVEKEEGEKEEEEEYPSEGTSITVQA